METYRVIEDWQFFFKFISENIKSDFQNEIGFEHRGNEIYIRSYNEYLLNIIRKKYKLVKCDQPDFFFDKEGWESTGNSKLFDIIPQ